MMKNFIKKSLSILAAGLLMSFNAEASDNENPKTIIITEAGKIIKEHIKFPNFTMNFNEVENVNVVFTVNEEGHINLVIANTSNELLKKSIETQFAKLVLKQLKANNTYSIQFNFKTI
jgi:DNA/RNA endonuclease YhcR with UshA esterase domain